MKGIALMREEMIHGEGEGNFFLVIQLELRNSNPVGGRNSGREGRDSTGDAVDAR